MADNHPFLGDFKPMDRDDFIQHYGVKGMKWGVRRKKGGVEKSSKPKSKSSSERKAEVQSMSDTELRSKINRLQMEKQYLDLTAPKTSKGKNEVQKILLNTAKQELTKVAARQTAKLVQDALKSAT